MDDLVKRRQLADFLRTRRARLRPEQVGLPSGGGRRRTAGLRREEVALLSGLSVAWYTWLEQGRQIKLSASAAKRLARALRLDELEETHLVALTDNTEPFRSEATIDVSPTLRRIVNGQGGNPAYVMNESWQVLAWNSASYILFGDFSRSLFNESNVLRYMFLDGSARRCIVDWESHARRMVAQFRLTSDRLGHRPEVAALITDLRAGSCEFDRLWNSHEVMRRGTGRKDFDHPRLGRLSFDHGAFQVNESRALKLVIYMAADERTKVKMTEALRHSSCPAA